LRTYESIYVIQPEAPEPEVEAVIAAFDALIAEDGGEIVTKDLWGKRRLAYEVKGFREGIYVLTRFKCPATFPKKFEAALKLNEQIIRYLVILFDEKTLRLEEEQAKRNAAALESRNASGPRSRDGDDDDDERRPASASARARAEA